MKIDNIDRKKFGEIASDFVRELGPEVTLHIFKRYVIGAVIDMCYDDMLGIVINGSIYTVGNNSRTGDVWHGLDNIAAESVGEWIARVELALLP